MPLTLPAHLDSLRSKMNRPSIKIIKTYKDGSGNFTHCRFQVDVTFKENEYPPISYVTPVEVHFEIRFAEANPDVVLLAMYKYIYQKMLPSEIEDTNLKTKLNAALDSEFGA